MKNIAFVGGGTGGHVFPIKSLIEYVNNNQNKYKFNNIYRVGESSSLEEKIAMDINSVYFLSILSGKWRRERGIKPFLNNILDLFKVFLGILKSIGLILTKKIDIIFCKGGYVALPFVIAGWILRKKIYVHESDTVAGLANKVASKFTKNIFTGFPDIMTGGKFVGQVLSDNLLSSEISKNIELLPNSNLTNILLIGGSQGSEYLYNSIYKLFDNDTTLSDRFNLYVILGTRNISIGEKFKNIKNCKTFEFISQEDMGYLMRNCDIGITRGGATSIAEQKYFNMNLLIVPLPYTGGNHQYYNGLYYQKQFNDVVLKQDEKLLDGIKDFLNKNIGFKKEIKINEKVDAKSTIMNDIITNIS